MKRQIFATSLLVLAATAAFAQGNINFKTSATKDPVYYTTGYTASGASDPSTLVLVGTDGTAGFYGHVSFGFLTAPIGTAPLTESQLLNVAYDNSVPAGWTESAPGAVTFTGPGVVGSQAVTLPASAGAPGANALLDVFAYTETLGNSTLFGWSGETFAGGSVTFNSITTSTGALGWIQPTGDPNNALSTPGTIPTGAGGLGSIVLYNPFAPEPSTVTIGLLGASVLFLFRRRK